jgi:hypothetical protein
VVQELAKGWAVCLGPDQGEHRGCLDVVDDQGLQLGVAGGHRLGEDGDAEPAAGEIGDGARSAGLQRDVGLDALGGAGLVEHRPDPCPRGQAHDRVRGDVRQGDPRLSGQGVAGRQGRDEPFADDGQRAQPWGRGAGRSDEGQVRLARADAFGEPVGVVLNQGDLDSWVGAVEGGEGIEQRRDGARGDHADHEPAADQPVHGVHGLPDRAGGCEYGASVRQRRRSRRGQGGRAA